MATNLYAASHQWATRPDDQRFLTLEDLYAAVSARTDRARAKDLALGSFTLESEGMDELYLAGHNGARVAFTNWSFGQFATQLGTPAAYLRKLPAPLAQANLEYGLRFTPQRNDEVKILYQMPELDTPGMARAFTGTGYGRIWDAEITKMVMDMNHDGRWQVPLDAYNGVNSKRATTLYASDRDVFIFLVDQSRPIEVDGQSYFRGFYVSNSEVGKATADLTMFLYSYVCCNRIIWNAVNVQEIKIRHTSRAPERFAEEFAPALAAMAEASATPVVEAIKRAKNERLGVDEQDVAKWLVSKGFGKFEAKVGLQLAEQGGESGSSGDPTNAWDVVQGLTAYARTIPHQDRRVDFETKVGSLLRTDGTAVR